jgi:uncharacterized protein (TIGR03066 family)
MRTHILTVAAIVSTLGCIIGPAAVPSPTAKKVAVADFVGTWSYEAEFRKTAIRLDLKADGTFTQTVNRGNGQVLNHQGTWKLDGTHLRISVLAPDPREDDKNWKERDASWWIVDGLQDGVPFAIFGGAGIDPDSWENFKKDR